MIFFLGFIFFSLLYSQENRVQDSTFSFIFETDSIIINQDSVGIFNGHLINNSISDVTLKIIRSVDFINEEWSSSICVDAICYNQSIDSISLSLPVGDSVECGVIAWTNGIGYDEAQLEIFELNDPINHILVDINFSVEYYVATFKNDRHSKPYKIISCYPNPFNPTTQIRYNLSEYQFVSIVIYDITGSKIRSLVNSKQPAGHHIIPWDAKDDIGKDISSGIYIYSIQVGEYRSTKSIVFLK